MANWSGVARTNFVIVEKPEQLKNIMDEFGIQLIQHDLNPEYYFLAPGEQSEGEFPSSIYDDDGDEICFSFDEHVMPYVKEGEVLIVQSCGSEKLRFLDGESLAFRRIGTKVEEVSVSMDEIYQRAAESFGLQETDIARCEYSALPKALERNNKAPKIRYMT